jgi:glucokinase
MKKYGFGVDIGGTSIKFGLFDEHSHLVEKWEIPTDSARGGNAVCKSVATEIQAKIAKYSISQESLIGVGVGVPAVVDKNGIIVIQGANLRWEDFNVKELLEGYLGIPVCVLKDVNAALLGEIRHGSAKNASSAVLITLGTGLGCATLIDGRLVYGSGGYAGELGHVCVNKDEKEPCGCGKLGCLEQYASASGIVKIARRMMIKAQVPTVLDGEKMTAKDIFAAYGNGDALALGAVKSFVGYLCRAIEYLTAIIDPQLIIIGGGVSLAGEPLLDAIRAECNGSFGFGKCKLQLASLGNDAGVIGAFSEIISRTQGGRV